ncbi:unnamed protein product [Paramecium pentaurelia]|uniref:Uncharacterized protein n=1 Tax=Paramecium pentaurelia TaxID=43138 RepID=A0A8S1WZQ6_9CILI|nr:unnamed protein product [Paramecium pentaurelia]
MNFYLNQFLIWDFYDKWEGSAWADNLTQYNQMDLEQYTNPNIYWKSQFDFSSRKTNLIFDEINRKIIRVRIWKWDEYQRQKRIQILFNYPKVIKQIIENQEEFLDSNSRSFQIYILEFIGDTSDGRILTEKYKVIGYNYIK